MMEVSQYTDKGIREENQDYMSWLSISEDASIFVLADGMGGYVSGDMAAKVVVDSIVEFVQHNLENYLPQDLLKESLSYANDCLMLKKMALSVPKMGCVVVALLIIKNEAYLTWLGDSRIYMFRDGEEVYRTTDHSILNELKKINTLRAEDIEKYSAIVTKSIMGEDTMDEAPIRKVKVAPGDVFILCSDGLYKEYNPVALIAGDEELRSKATSFQDNVSYLEVKL